MKLFLATFLGTTAIGLTMFFNFEPGLTLAVSDTGTTTVTLIVMSEIAVSAGASIDMAPNLGMTQDSSIGSGVFTVQTTDAGGYTLSFNASTTPAMRNGTDNFDDYSEILSGTPENWSVEGGVYEFGFSAYGDDTDTGVWGAGGECGTAGAETLSSTLKWRGFTGTTPVAGVAVKDLPAGGAGAATTICVAAEQGNMIYAPSGSYSATIVGTASTQ